MYWLGIQDQGHGRDHFFLRAVRWNQLSVSLQSFGGLLAACHRPLCGLLSSWAVSTLCAWLCCVQLSSSFCKNVIVLSHWGSIWWPPCNIFQPYSGVGVQINFQLLNKSLDTVPILSSVIFKVHVGLDLPVLKAPGWYLRADNDIILRENPCSFHFQFEDHTTGHFHELSCSTFLDHGLCWYIQQIPVVLLSGRHTYTSSCCFSIALRFQGFILHPGGLKQ